MAHSRADIRYARALFMLAEKKGASSAVNEDLRALRNLIQTSAELKAFIAHPLLPADKQGAVIRATFGKRLGEITVNFLCFLATRRRLRVLQGICECYEDLYLAARNILRIGIVSAFELRKDQVDAIQKTMTKHYGKEVLATVSMDASLLGGFLVNVQDTVHDYSIRGKLSALRLALCGG